MESVFFPVLNVSNCYLNRVFVGDRIAVHEFTHSLLRELREKAAYLAAFERRAKQVKKNPSS